MIYLKKIQSLHFLTNFQLHKQPLKPIIPSTWLNSSTPYQPSHFSLSFLRPFYPSAQFHKESISTEKKRTKKPLCVFFQESVGLLEKSEQSESGDQTDNESENKGLKCKLRKLEEEVRILREKKKNEKANRVLENEGKGKKLYELFVNDEGKRGKSRKLALLTMEDHTVYKELSPDMVMFVKHLYNEGYFKDSNFLPRKKFDITCFENSYARDFVKCAAEQFGRDHQEIANKEEARNGNGVLENEGKSVHELFVNEEGKSVKSRKSMPLTMENPTVYKGLSPDMVMCVTHLYNEGYFKDSNFLPGKKFDIICFENSYARDFAKYAAEQFGRDHQEITKWLSGSDLKKVALFGCPSIAKKTVFSAKKLRSYFRIQEDNVCSKCALKASCKFVNQSVWKGDMTNLHLTVVMRVITLYALESVPSQLVIPDEIKASVNRLLMDILRLSQTVP